MERDSITHIGNLKIGDRFCFPADRKKGIVCEVTKKRGYITTYTKNGFNCKCSNFYKEVIFLRSQEVVENG